jgi:FlaA1/EpsC-like NDP-sugar epimerase
MNVVGFVDDKPETHGRTLHGVSVLGGTDRLRELVARHNVELLAIAIRGASGEQTRRVVERCRETGIDFKIIPSLDELLAGRATIGQLRDVSIDDLLGREPVTLNMEQIKRDLAGKSILVTGGAGSIGSELARQIASYGPERLVLLERAENALYFTHLEVARAHPEVEVVPFIGSITNPDRLEEMFRLYRPNYVFHAAAYKHVPLLEANVTEAVWNNVFGTLRLAECAALHGVEKFVLISTDKAVNPTSVLGATKRIGERIVLELPSLCDAPTDFRAVRFGNVLGSDGSVVPLFKRQISAGGPVKVTHPEVTRYFMTIPEAVQLVLEAAALPEAERRISILEMGKPVRILELAEQLIRLSGLEPYKDIQIAFSGLRPGEKLAEELVASAEGAVATSVEKIRVIERSGADGAAVERHLEHLLHILSDGSRDELIDAISRLVPEYVPWRTRERPLPVVPRPRTTPDPRAPLRPVYARASGGDGMPKSATA